jgi:glutamine synthetase
MADRHVVYKQCVKDVADQMGQSVTFMAKPWEDQAGSSCHIHLSLWSEDSNAFAGDTDFEGIACSDAFRWFLGGWMKHAPEMMAMYASTVNSYKRYQSASWAPTTLAWSYDNRTAGFRIVGKGSSLRIECRVPGADCNVYLAFAAALASGLDGIKNQTEPPEMLKGDAYKTSSGQLPTRMSDATESFKASDFAREAFGGGVVDHYVHHMENERAAYERAVTDWERGRYFEQI